MGESAFSEAMIKESLLKKEAEIVELRNAEEFLQSEMQYLKGLKQAEAERKYELENWADLFDRQELPKQRAMLQSIISRVDVWADRIEVTYNTTLDCFIAAKSPAADNPTIHSPAQENADLLGFSYAG